MAKKDWGGMLAGLLGAAILAGIAWWLWPAGIVDEPLSQLTLGKLFSAAASAGFWWWAILTFGAAFG